ncbi:hypothetical protein SAMN05216304_11322 [Bosea sp. OK403]|nr:hypothetical protein SAMN05216304_11322 [Bosea sp. OK403]
MSLTFPLQRHFKAVLRQSPRYQGSIHDDATANRYGFESALIPGDHLYGFMSQIALEQWGEDWLIAGTISSRSRRPVYHGQTLLLSASGMIDDDVGARVDIAIANEAGDVVAKGSIGLPKCVSPPPDVVEFPVIPLPGAKPIIARGEMTVGKRLFTLGLVLDDEEHQEAVAQFQEVWPGYASRKIVPAARLLRVALRDEVASYTYPTPSIYVAARAQHLSLAYAGDVLSTSSIVTNSYERNGGEYFDCDTALIANGSRLVALFQRTTLYAARQQ